MKKYSLIIIISFSVQAFAFAQANPELQGLINKAIGYFPRLKELEQAELIQAERLKLVEGNQKPTVTGAAGYTYVNPIGQAVLPIGPGIEKVIQFQPNNNFNSAVTANYLIYDFGKLKASIDKSKEELKYSKQNTAYNQLQLASQVANIYYNIVFLKEAIRIQDSVIAFYRTNLSLVESKLKYGDALKVDQLNILASIDNELNRKVDLQNALQRQVGLLEYTTSASSVTGNRFDFKVKDGNTDEFVKKAEGQNPEFALIKSKMVQAKADIEVARLQYYPNLNATASAGYKNGYQPNIFETRFNYLAGLNLSVPIYNGNKNRVQEVISKQALKQLELNLESTSSVYRKDIKQVLTDIGSNRERLKNIESQVELSKSLLQLTNSRYKNGVATYLDISSAATGIQRAELSKLQYSLQLCLSEVELARLVGEKFW